MHTPLKITVEAIDHDNDGTPEQYIVESHGGSAGAGSRCVCTSPENVETRLQKIVTDWREHNAALADAETGKQIETSGVVGEQ